MFRRLAIAIAVALVAMPAAAIAHPKLISATPAVDATVAAPTRIALRFSERLIPKLSGASVVMTGMAGMTHAPMAIPGTKSAVGPDGNSIMVTTAKPLPAGTYRVDWHVVSGDTHRITGTYAFTVK